MRRSRSAIIGIFSNQEKACAAIRALREAHFTSEQIGVMTGNRRIEPELLITDTSTLDSPDSKTLIAVGNTNRLGEALIILRYYQLLALSGDTADAGSFPVLP